MEHRRKKKGSSKLLIIMVIVLALLAIAAIFALKFYTDINNPENLFESTLPEGTPAPVETAPAPADEEAQPSPTPDQESLLSGQADAEFMSNRTNILLLGIDESTDQKTYLNRYNAAIKFLTLVAEGKVSIGTETEDPASAAATGFSAKSNPRLFTRAKMRGM